ncbi:MAG: hypothetical protein ACOC1F_12720 [Myxococcota bacterium]
MDVRGHAQPCELELTKVSDKGPRRLWAATRDKNVLETRAGPVGRPPKVTPKSFPDDASAARAFDKAVRAKLRSGYAFVRDPSDASRGDIVTVAFASGGGGGPILDLSVDGKLALTAGCKGAPVAVWLETIETTSGKRRRIFDKSVAAGRQIFLHSACFDRTGQAVILLLGKETLRLDLVSGKLEPIAKYVEFQTARFNPFLLHPHFDRARERLVVFDKRSLVRVLDSGGNQLFEVSMEHPTTECRAAQLSPSGKLLALVRVSRGIVYNHDDAKHDATNAVDVWDVDTGKRRDTIELETPVDQVGIDSTDRLLTMSWQYAQGPVIHDLRMYQELHRFTDPWRTDRLATAYGWDWSPDGSLLAVGREGLSVYAAEDIANITDVPVESSGEFRVKRVVFSGDGTLLGTYEGGLFVLRSMR